MGGDEGSPDLGTLIERGKEAPSWYDYLHIDKHAHFLGLEVEYWIPVSMALIVGLVLVAVSYLGTRRLQEVPRGLQAFLENIVDGFREFLRGVMGDAANRYVPLLGSIFLYILVMNYWALLPGMHAATSSLSTTLGLATVIFFVTHYEGIRAHGLGGYLKHFVGDPWWLAPLNIPIHVIGEFARPVSLSLRLFGNIMGEDTLVAAIVAIAVFIMTFVPIPLPLQFPLMFLALLAGLIQALVFTLLSAIYIGGAVGAFEEPGHGHERGHGQGQGQGHGQGHGQAAHAKH